MKATLTFTPETGALSISGTLMAGQKMYIEVVNGDHATNPISGASSLQLTIKADNDKENASPFVCHTTWTDSGAGVYFIADLNLDIASLLAYLGNADSKMVEVELRDNNTNEILGYDQEVSMHNPTYRTGDAADDPTSSISDQVKAILGALDIDIVFTSKSIGVVLLSRDGEIEKRLVVSDGSFLGAEDA